MKKHLDARERFLKKYTEEKKKNGSKGDYKYENPKTGEIFIYSRKGPYKKDGVYLVYKGIA